MKDKTTPMTEWFLVGLDIVIADKKKSRVVGDVAYECNQRGDARTAVPTAGGQVGGGFTSQTFWGD